MKRLSTNMVSRGLLAAAVIGVGLSLAGAAPERKVFEAEARWLDDRLPEAERNLLAETVGYAFPGFDEYGEDLVWLAHKPDPEALQGKVLILQSFTTADAQRRGVLRRAENLARRGDEQVVFIAVHTPEGASEAERFTSRAGIPVVLDRTGRFSDDMGFWKTPAATVIDRSGTIRLAGANVLQSNRFIEAIASEESKGEAAKLLSREDRDKKKGDAKPAHPGKVEFPDAPPVSGANDLRGKPAPQLQVQKYITPQPDTKGKVVMVEFWATWCGPCIAGIPHLNELQSEFRDDLVIIGVSDEDEGKVNEFRSNRSRPTFGYTVAIDPQRRMMNAVGPRGIPHCIVYSSDGIVRWQGHPARLDKASMQLIVDANRSLGSPGGDTGMRWVQTKTD